MAINVLAVRTATAAFVILVLAVCGMQGYTEPPCPVVVIHPTITASGPDDNLSISAKCPDGMIAEDPESLLHPHMTIAESITGISKLVCVKK